MIFLKEKPLGDPIIKQFLKVLCKKLNRSLLFGHLKYHDYAVHLQESLIYIVKKKKTGTRKKKD